MKRNRLALLFVLLMTFSAASLLAVPPEAPPEIPWTFEPHRVADDATPELLGGPTSELALVIDDGTAEGDVGLNGNTALQFMWLNRLSPPAPMLLEQIQVLFPASPNFGPGDPIDLVVYRDDDGDPSTGAELLAVFGEQIQLTDGVSFSTYSIALDEVLNPSDDLYIGVIPRFIESGVTPPTNPAALDTTAPQGRSWLVTWQAGPPASPTLPSDGQTVNVDDLVPGNWLIRGFGSPAPVIEIPTASTVGLLVMGLLLAIAALVSARRC